MKGIVYRCYDADGRLLYVGSTMSTVETRLTQHRYANRVHGKSQWISVLDHVAVVVVIVCIVAIVAAAHGVWWLAGICLLGALLLGAAEFVDDERRRGARRRLRAELRRHKEQR